MDDRALLEAAAKAAGVTIKWFEDTDEPWCFIPDRHPPHNRRENDKISGVIWNPLTDDGDALRLAVKLRQLRVHIDIESTAAFRNTARGDPGVFAGEPHGTDPAAATRRAVVRAAAAIGMEMP